MSANRYLIWSIEHNAWWKPNSFGYTTAKEEAGRFKFEEACQIVKEANLYCKPGEKNEEMYLDK